MPVEVLLLALQLLGSLEEFLQNQAVRSVLSDAELIDKALEQLGKNEAESARIREKIERLQLIGS